VSINSKFTNNPITFTILLESPTFIDLYYIFADQDY
jgi:hypothetical protein